VKNAYRRAKGKSLTVREYLRHRLGKWETVKSHLRKWPRSSEAISK
jgi:hypothetical protein